MNTITINLRNYNNNLKDVLGNPAIEEVTIEPKSIAGEIWLEKVSKLNGCYDVHDIEWVEQLSSGRDLQIVSRKVVGYSL